MTTPAPSPENLYRLQTSPLRGFPHHGHPNWLHEMKIGESLILLPEPANPHDRHAVRVHWHDHHIGYLPRESNHVVSRLLRQHCPLTARIAWLANDLNPHTPLSLDVFLPKPQESTTTGHPS